MSLPRPKAAEVKTLAAGDPVVISLKGRAIDAINAWAGEVVSVDGTAIRVRVAWYRFTLSTMAAEGERVIPWSRIESVKIEAGS